jgi:hypothetical protein
LRACCATRAPAGCGVTPSRWTRRLATSSTDSTYSRWNSTASTVKPIASVPLAWARRTAARRSRPRRCGIDAGAVEDGPSGAGPDPGAEPAQLAVEPAVAPCRVLLGQPRHQRTDLGRDHRAATPVRVGPPASDQLPMPAQQRSRMDDTPRRLGRGSSRASPASTARSAQSSCGLDTPAAVAPRPRDATAAARHPWQPNSVSAAQSTPSPCRTSSRAVAGSSADHGDQMTALANSQLNVYDRLPGTHRVGMCSPPRPPVADDADLASGVGRPARRGCPGTAQGRVRRRPRRLVHPSITCHSAAPWPPGERRNIKRPHRGAGVLAAPIPGTRMGQLAARRTPTPFDSLHNPCAPGQQHPQPALAAAPLRPPLAQHPGGGSRRSGSQPQPGQLPH